MAVFNPEKLKSSSSICGIGKLKRRGFPPRANLSIIGPPGYGMPKILADLSKASPAASSLVWPIIFIVK